MSENNYQLVAWTENGEIKFSGYAMWEQEMLLQDEIDSIDTFDLHRFTSFPTVGSCLPIRTSDPGWA